MAGEEQQERGGTDWTAEAAGGWPDPTWAAPPGASWALGRQGREPPPWAPCARTLFPPWLAKGLMQLRGYVGPF